MGRIKLRAKFVTGLNGKLSDADSRDAKTVADAQYKFFKPKDPCPDQKTGDECVSTNGCSWVNNVCAAATGSGCENNNLKETECKKDKKCFYDKALCA
jgi:hypothetical protein